MQAGSYISKTNPAFDARNYGFKKLSELVRSLKYVEIKDQPVAKPDGGSISNLLIRIKRAEATG
jgi:OST-HTH/LOTUS domain